MDFYEDVLDQKEKIIKEGGVPKWISCSQGGFTELLGWLATLYLDGKIPFSPFSKIEEFLGLPVILNPEQEKWVKVLRPAREEYLAYEVKHPIMI